MKYIVKTEGKVYDVQNQAYEVVARNKNEAEEIARSMFMEEYPVADTQLYAKAKGTTLQTIIAVIALTAAVLLTFIKWVDGRTVVSLMPNIISSIYAVAIYSAYVLRYKGIRNMFKSWTDVLFCPLLILLFSSFVQALFATTTLKLFIWEVPFDAKLLLFVTMLLSWLGMRIMSVLCIVVLMLFSIGNLYAVSAAMGNLFGTIYVIASFIGIIAYAATEPAFYYGLKSFTNDTLRGTSQFRNDLSYTKDAVKNAASGITSKDGE